MLSKSYFLVRSGLIVLPLILMGTSVRSEVPRALETLIAEEGSGFARTLTYGISTTQKLSVADQIKAVNEMQTRALGAINKVLEKVTSPTALTGLKLAQYEAATRELYFAYEVEANMRQKIALAARKSFASILKVTAEDVAKYGLAAEFESTITAAKSTHAERYLRRVRVFIESFQFTTTAYGLGKQAAQARLAEQLEQRFAIKSATTLAEEATVRGTAKWLATRAVAGGVLGVAYLTSAPAMAASEVMAATQMGNQEYRTANKDDLLRAATNEASALHQLAQESAELEAMVQNLRDLVNFTETPQNESTFKRLINDPDYAPATASDRDLARRFPEFKPMLTIDDDDHADNRAAFMRANVIAARSAYQRHLDEYKNNAANVARRKFIRDNFKASVFDLSSARFAQLTANYEDPPWRDESSIIERPAPVWPGSSSDDGSSQADSGASDAPASQQTSNQVSSDTNANTVSPSAQRQTATSSSTTTPTSQSSRTQPTSTRPQTQTSQSRPTSGGTASRTAVTGSLPSSKSSSPASSAPTTAHGVGGSSPPSTSR